MVYDKYWDMETLQYKRTTIIPVVEQKRITEQIASIIEVIERTYSDKADSTWLKQSIEDVLHPTLHMNARIRVCLNALQNMPRSLKVQMVPDRQSCVSSVR